MGGLPCVEGPVGGTLKAMLGGMESLFRLSSSSRRWSLKRVSRKGRWPKANARNCCWPAGRGRVSLPQACRPACLPAHLSSIYFNIVFLSQLTCLILSSSSLPSECLQLRLHQACQPVYLLQLWFQLCLPFQAVLCASSQLETSFNSSLFSQSA